MEYVTAALFHTPDDCWLATCSKLRIILFCKNSCNDATSCCSLCFQRRLAEDYNVLDKLLLQTADETDSSFPLISPKVQIEIKLGVILIAFCVFFTLVFFLGVDQVDHIFFSSKLGYANPLKVL